MRRPRSGIGPELVPLLLILACLAGSLALILSIHRRAIPRGPSRPVAVVALAPAPPPARPTPTAPAPVAVKEDPEPEPLLPPPPEDPTPKELAKLASAEAEQLLEASRADRQAAALEEARKAAEAESGRWRRRQSLVRSQVASLETRARKLETDADELAFERDALEKERDARKAATSRAGARPGQAILPHKGMNGTWRRPIVVECTNGMAIIRPRGLGFGLLELSSGFGPSSNPFVAAVAREAIATQRKASPDGQPVVPYIFFLVRPDGIRPYYEARGRLESLGITFGYELADQDWEVDVPDLDDFSTWDGSAPGPPPGEDSRSRPGTRGGGTSPAEDDDFPAWGGGTRRGPVAAGDGGEFTWPAKPRYPSGGAGRGDGPSIGDGAGSRAGRSGVDPLGPPPGPPGGSGTLAGRIGETTGGGRPGSREVPADGRPGELPPGVVGGDPLARLGPGPGAAPGRTGGPKAAAGPGLAEVPAGGPSVEGRTAPIGATGRRPGGLAPEAQGSGKPGAHGPAGSDARGEVDPGVAFVWPARPGSGSRDPDGISPPIGPSRTVGVDLGDPPSGGNPPPSIAANPSRLAGPSPGGQDAPAGGPPRDRVGASDDRGTGGSRPPTGMIGRDSGMPASGSPPAGAGGGMPAIPGLSSPGSPASGSPDGRPGSAPKSFARPEVPSAKIVDRRFEVVVVCGPKGVTVQPGAYRVTAAALKDRDGLLKKQMVALVRARRAADPGVTIEPRVRFLVQPGGEATYRAARGQALLSGLDWPMTTQVADPDFPTILPMEGW